tara:strand:+ start:7763 stop:9295 length:1533 start_codon:yes stop_codon:yes gene_type:complete
MGLFDNLNFDDPKTMGLLSAAANMLNASGPSTTPRSFGQILGSGLGGGMQGYQGAQQAQSENAFRQIKAKQANMDLEKSGFEMDQLRSLLARDNRIQEALQKRRQPQVGVMPIENMGKNENTELLSNGLAGNSIISNLSQGAMPQQAASSFAGGQTQPKALGMPSQNKQNATRAFVDSMISDANVYMENGDSKTAIEMYDKASKLMPSVDKWQTANFDGKIYSVPYFKDGTAGEPIPYEVAEKLHFANTGGKTVGANPYTGATVSSITNTQSPDSRASTAVQMRGQNMTDARARENIGLRSQEIAQKGFGINKPIPVGALKLRIEAQDAADIASGINDRLSTVQKRIGNGELSLGPVSNVINSGLNFSGMSTEASRNLASFKADLEKLRNDSLRLNKGVQTEGDSQRAWNEILTNINDQELVKQRLAEVKEINERAKNLRLMEVDSINRNYGVQSDAQNNQVEQPTQQKQAQSYLPALPTANKSNQGKTAIDHDTGKRYKSNGMQWMEVK